MALTSGGGPVGTSGGAGRDEAVSADEQAPGVDDRVVRDSSGTAVGRSKGRLRFAVVGLIVLVALGFLLAKGLGSATLYFKTADEAVAQRDQLGTRRFRIEGVVVGQPAKQADGLHFVIENNNQDVNVLHTGDEPALFQPNIPVVLEGHFDPSGTYLSDRILVKHTASYTDKHPDRVKDYTNPSNGTP